MARRSFLILHGWQGSGPEHWQSWRADRLRAAGERVSYPELPDPDEPRRARWSAALARALAELDPGGVVVVCHSLGSLLWLHHAVARPRAPVARALLVAPPRPAVAIPELAEFFPVELDRTAVAGAAGETRIVCADADPYCPAGAAAVYGAPLGIPTDVIPGAGHVNPDAGYGPWPALEDWCLTGRAPIGPRA